MINDVLSDKQRVTLTLMEYNNLEIGEKIQVDQFTIGYVQEHIYTEDGFQCYVIVDNPKKVRELTLLFKGSTGLRYLNKKTFTDEWLATNLPILKAMLLRNEIIPSQLKTASKSLKLIIKRYPGAKIYIYGHSLGSINAQYALANSKHIGRFGNIYLYEGPNIYLLLNRQQKKRIKRLRSRIFNYIDIYDPVTLGFVNNHDMVGQLKYIDSKLITPIRQHMLAAYEFDDFGNLKTKTIDENFMKSAKSFEIMMSMINSWQVKLQRTNELSIKQNYLLSQSIKQMILEKINKRRF